MALRPVIGGFVNIPSSNSSSLIDPSIAWFSSAGNTSTGAGTPSNPYGNGNGQKAYDAGFRSFRVGAGCGIGNVNVTDITDTLSIFGAGLSSSVGSILINQISQIVAIYLSGKILVTSISADAAGSTLEHLDGYSGNTLNLFIDPTSKVTLITAFGGNAFDDGSTSARGGDGGAITIVGGGDITNNLLASGGSGVNAGLPGSGGFGQCRGAFINAVFYTNDLIIL